MQWGGERKGEGKEQGKTEADMVDPLSKFSLKHCILAACVVMLAVCAEFTGRCGENVWIQ